ncbi:MAG: YfhO family protein, partial [Colwellia sp.]|nr:YfhO family protein [Colwellia sp.]
KGEGEFKYSIERYDYDSCDIEVSSDNEGFLYWADGYDEGWHASVNNREVPVYRANKNFKAIAIPKGTSYINFNYNPVLFKAGFGVFYGTFVICVLAMLVSSNYNFMRNGRFFLLFKVGYFVFYVILKVCILVVMCLFKPRKGISSLKSFLLNSYHRSSNMIE